MAIRISRGEKRSALAERCGISYKHMYGIEQGYAVNQPSIEVLHRIANALEVEIDQVLANDEGPKDEPKATPGREANPTTHPSPGRPVQPAQKRRDRTRTAGSGDEVGAA